ncbi:MAG: hypothetical protein VX913_00750 [Planctomycetota bacterium]|nr:hypothetical protein [Planctomycetota bacterium]
MSRLTLILLILCPIVSAQFDDQLWLVQAAGGGPGRVFECDRDGSIVGRYPGPAFGSGGVLKDLFLNRVWVCDDGYWNGLGVSTGAVRSYAAGLGQTGIIPKPGARAIAQISGGDLAVLINPHPLQASSVEIIPAGGGVGTVVTVGTHAVEMVAGRDDTVWTLNRVSGTISRVQNGIAQTVIPVTSNAALDRLVLLPSGGVLVTFQGQSLAAIFDSTGVNEVPVNLPEPVIRVAADADTSVFMLGQSRQVYRFNLRSGVITDQFPVSGVAFGALIPAQGGRIWIEETTTKTITCFGFGGAVLISLSTPYATHSRGDPLGLEWSCKTAPGADVGGDGVASGAEIRRGTDVLDGTDFPPSLYEVGAVGNFIPIGLSAPGRPGQVFVLLASLSGVRPVSLGVDGASAPYFDLAVFDDGLAYAMLVNPVIQAHLINMPFGMLDGSGLGLSAIDLSGFASLPGGLLQIYCCAMILGPGNSVEATTNPVCFDNLGTPCL